MEARYEASVTLKLNQEEINKLYSELDNVSGDVCYKLWKALKRVQTVEDWD